MLRSMDGFMAQSCLEQRGRRRAVELEHDRGRPYRGGIGDEAGSGVGVGRRADRQHHVTPLQGRGRGRIVDHRPSDRYVEPGGRGDDLHDGAESLERGLQPRSLWVRRQSMVMLPLVYRMHPQPSL